MRAYEYDGPTAGLRFAILARVSTPEQMASGDSIPNQVKTLRDYVKAKGGVIVNATRYVGQEHGTPGHERHLLMRLLDDAEAGEIDAVVVDRLDRWNRGNPLAEAGLDTFRDHGVRFFVVAMGGDQDLESVTQRGLLSILSTTSNMGVQANNKAGHESRLIRAAKGWPQGGSPRDPGKASNLFYGRRLVKSTGRKDSIPQWELVAEQVEEIEKATDYYLEPNVTWAMVGKRFGVGDNTWRCRILDRAGDRIEVKYQRRQVDVKKLAGMENVRIEGNTVWITFHVPRLLSDEKIAAVREKSTAQRPVRTARPEGAAPQYLRGYFRCPSCKDTLDLHHNRPRDTIYVDHYGKRSKPLESVNCQTRLGHYSAELEASILNSLITMVTDPATFESAIRAAVKHQALTQPEAARRLDEIEQEEKKIEAAIGKLVAQLEVDDSPALIARVKSNAARHQVRLDALQVEAAKLREDRKVVALPAQLPEVLALARVALDGKKTPKRLFWPTEEKLRLLHYLFGVAGKRRDEAEEFPAGVYLRKLDDGRIEWAAKTQLGVTLTQTSGPSRINAAAAAGFFTEFSFGDIRHSSNVRSGASTCPRP